MAKKGNPINGWLVIDKAPDMTSTDVVRAIKRMLRPQKIGHAGTLDPLATGILPIALGEATKTIPYIVDATKDYDFTVAFGAETTTDDLEGEVTTTSEVRPNQSEIEKYLPEFVGTIQQTPPKFSAIKVDGQRAYKLARAGEEVELKSRPVEILSFQMVELAENGSEGRFFVTSGKGTYIRALARDIGRKLGCLGHVKTLKRTRVGPFAEKNAISLDKLDDLSHSARALEAVKPVMTALDDIPALAVTKGEAERAKNGQALSLPTSRSGLVVLTHDGALIALAKVEAKIAQPVRVFNL